MADEEPAAVKRAKYSHCDDLLVTDEMMKNFSQDGYIIVKCVYFVIRSGY